MLGQLWHHVLHLLLIQCFVLVGTLGGRNYLPAETLCLGIILHEAGVRGLGRAGGCSDGGHRESHLLLTAGEVCCLKVLISHFKI